ncbi:hypothetical protein BDEG_26776 [Batrachochytrium dendrobatidis JEL423]|uniref:Sidoreflexin n=1 Tax=Batrachochytrium dendrobatidis (strain JEL423) TaxID=403673 RepID=A0A177WUS3_BATDL|nr:hypothetical protein BDEG_26776 [Batrachochytrium dendrobatidis JEL423]
MSESIQQSLTKRIDLSQSRYDQSTYMGRLRHFSEITDPRNLFASETELQAAKTLVQSYKAGNSTPNVTEEQLWKAKKLVDSTFHPDTGEKVFLPFRMSSYVPTNVPIIAAMLLPNPSVAAIIFWQWINQSANVAFNYCNANKTTEMSTTETVGASCTIAVGLSQWLARSKGLSPSTLTLLSRGVPFVAVATAGTLNVFLMRQKELKEGIQVQDATGTILGKSQTAGTHAIGQVAVSRVVTAAPALFIPGLIMSQMERTSLFKRFPRLVAPFNLITVAGSLLAALPCAIALFPQVASIGVEKLEPQFKGLVDANGKPVERVFFNRGL